MKSRSIVIIFSYLFFFWGGGKRILLRPSIRFHGRLRLFVINHNFCRHKFNFTKLLFARFCFEGEKGESYVSAERANTAGICARSIAGAVHYNASQNALEWCNGKVWLPVVIGGKGLAANQPGRHCLDILKSGEFEIKHPCKEKIENYEFFPSL